MTGVWLIRTNACRAGAMVPTDRIVLDKAILMPACGKAPLTPVLYLDAIDIPGVPTRRAE